MGRIIDITPEISEKMAVYPGDTPYVRKVLFNFDKGAHFALSAITTTVHIGAHADAPNHYAKGGAGIHERALEYYFGNCQVISVKIPRGARILPEHLKNRAIEAERVLFRTDSFLDVTKWCHDYNSLSPELVDFLAKRKVKLVGIDTPSIDLDDDKILLSHAAVAENDMAVLEGLALKDVKDGLYDLVALPLKIKDADASPVRAILVEKS